MQQILLVQERLRRNGLNAADIEREMAEVRRLNDKGPAQQAARDFNGWLQMLGEAVQAERALQDPLQKQAQISRILAGLSPADINARALQWVNAPDRALFMLAPGLSPLTLPSKAGRAGRAAKNCHGTAAGPAEGGASDHRGQHAAAVFQWRHRAPG